MSPTWEYVREDLRTAADGPDQGLDPSAVRLFWQIKPISPHRPWLPHPDADFTHPWRTAALKLGVASDLLATHAGPQGHSRCPNRPNASSTPATAAPPSPPSST